MSAGARLSPAPSTDLSAAGTIIPTAVSMERIFFLSSSVHSPASIERGRKKNPSFHTGFTIRARASCGDGRSHTNCCSQCAAEYEFNMISYERRCLHRGGFLGLVRRGDDACTCSVSIEMNRVEMKTLQLA